MKRGRRGRQQIRWGRWKKRGGKKRGRGKIRNRSSSNKKKGRNRQKKKKREKGKQINVWRKGIKEKN